MNALIVVDFQNDYCKGGIKEIKNTHKLIKLINNHIKNNNYNFIIFTKDWFPDNHKQFRNGNKYCVQDTNGSELSFKMNMNVNNIFIFKKGFDPNINTYSCFYENDHKTSTGLLEFLKEKNVDTIDICGLKTNTTIKNTAIDSVENNFNTTILLNLCADYKNVLNLKDLLNIKLIT
jgi:nicotinamidase/pyrazinamidase